MDDMEERNLEVPAGIEDPRRSHCESAAKHRPGAGRDTGQCG